MARIEKPKDILTVYSASLWRAVAANPERAYHGDCPSLAQVQRYYGASVAELWLYQQLLALFGASSSKDKGMVDSIEFYVSNFYYIVRGYKLSELMLFFSRYASGMYSDSYSAFDLRQIGIAFERFKKHRNEELDALVRQRMQAEIAARAFTPPEGYTSLSWYQHVKASAERGEQWAIDRLNNPTKTKDNGNQ